MANWIAYLSLIGLRPKGFINSLCEGKHSVDRNEI